MIQKHEPALLLIGILAPSVQILVSFAGLTVDQQGAVNAVAVALTGALTAWIVRTGTLPTLLVTLAQAIIAMALSFGAALSPELQAAIMAIVGVAVGAFTRTQVEAPPRRRRRGSGDGGGPEGHDGDGGGPEGHDGDGGSPVDDGDMDRDRLVAKV